MITVSVEEVSLAASLAAKLAAVLVKTISYLQERLPH